jgi:uracil-DNA glycosylase family 4
MITSVQQLNREVMERCRAYGLEWDCGADGNLNATIAVVGEAPGDKERQMKVPLVGGSGNFFWNVVRPYGITRRNVYVTNAIKRQLLVTGNDKYNKLTVSDGEAQLYYNILLWELAQLPELKYVVVLGTRALQAITGYNSIMNYRGSVMSVQMQHGVGDKKRVVTVVAINNPAHVLRQPQHEITFRMDCGRLNKVITGQFEEYKITERLWPTFDEAIGWMQKMIDDKLPVSLDIETSSGQMICVGLANDPHDGMCIPFRGEDDNWWTVEQEIELFKKLADLVSHPDVRLVMQNGMYDASWLWFQERIKVHKHCFYFDTMLAHHTLYPSLPHGLAFLTTQYTTHPYYKDDGKLWKEGGSITDEWSYNVKDVCITLKCYYAMLKELRDQGMEEFFFSHVMRLQPELVEMSVLGIKVDVDRKHELQVRLRAELAELKEQFWSLAQALTGEDEKYKPNPASPKQMQELYFKKLNLIGRGVSTDEENRTRIKQHPRTTAEQRKLLELVDEIQKVAKFLGTYVEATIDDDAKIRTEYKQHGVASAPGRLSSAGTGWGTGGNLQNQPSAAQEMYVADEGCEFSYFDLSQAEARVVGWRYAIHAWIDQFERARTDASGYDAHRALASEMFNVPYDEVPKEDFDENGEHTIRYISKRCRHGLNYRMMADRLATTLNIEINRAAYLWAVYHKTTPELQKGWESDTKLVRENRFIKNAFGRRWILLQTLTDEALEPIVAFYPQSTIGDKVSRIIYQCHSDPEWPTGEARICLNIHDALIALHLAKHGPLVRRIMKKYAEEPIPIEGHDGVTRDLIIPCDLKKSVEDETGKHRWSNLVKVKE